VNVWLKEGGEALKVKIEDEVERSVSKMGFVKRGEFEALKQEVAALKKGGASAKKRPAKKSAAKKPAAKKTGAQKSTAKNSAKKVVKKTAAKKVSK
jgi:BMFP domain-containing protein YqiC